MERCARGRLSTSSPRLTGVYWCAGLCGERRATTAGAMAEQRMLFSSSLRLPSRHLTYETDVGLRLQYNKRESINLQHIALE
jgi:hypothetical protein